MQKHWLPGYYRPITNAVFEAIECRKEYNNSGLGKSHVVKFDFYDEGEMRNHYIYGLLSTLDGSRMAVFDCTADEQVFLADVSLLNKTFEEKVSAIGRACGL